MAAHILVEFPISESKTVFTGTSEEDTAYLKIFWKSIHLNPTIESRLVSSDVRQRIPSHPLKSHERQLFSHRESDPPKLTEYHKNVFRLESEDQHKKRMSLLDKREEDFKRKRLRQEKREKVQESSRQLTVRAEPYNILPPITPEYNDDLDPSEQVALEAQQALNDIEIFEQILSTKKERKQPVDKKSLIFD